MAENPELFSTRVSKHLQTPNGLDGEEHALWRPEIQTEVRRRLNDDEALDRAIDEVLRIDDPFVANRRVTTSDATVDGPRELGWPCRCRRLRARGACGAPPGLRTGAARVPGASALATLELRLLVRAVLRASSWLEPAGTPVRSEPPLGGWASAPVVLRP